MSGRDREREREREREEILKSKRVVKDYFKVPEEGVEHHL
jgi:hypothetical protein